MPRPAAQGSRRCLASGPCKQQQSMPCCTKAAARSSGGGGGTAVDSTAAGAGAFRPARQCVQGAAGGAVCSSAGCAPDLPGPIGVLGPQPGGLRLAPPHRRAAAPALAAPQVGWRRRLCRQGSVMTHQMAPGSRAAACGVHAFRPPLEPCCRSRTLICLDALPCTPPRAAATCWSQRCEATAAARAWLPLWAAARSWPSSSGRRRALEWNSCCARLCWQRGTAAGRHPGMAPPALLERAPAAAAPGAEERAAAAWRLWKQWRRKRCSAAAAAMM